MVPALVVKQRLPHPPTRRLAHHLDWIAQTFDLRRNAQFVVQRSQRNLRPVANLRARVVGAWQNQTDETGIVRLQAKLRHGPESSDGIGKRFVRARFVIRRIPCSPGLWIQP